jgi:hypothetical protein
MWSIYYHSIYLPTLRKSVLDLVQAPSDSDTVPPPLRLLPLSEAVNVVLSAGAGVHDRKARLRRLQVLRKLAGMGLANPAYREVLIKGNETDSETVLRIKAAGKVVDLLVERVWEEFRLKSSIQAFRIMAPAEANSYLDEALSSSGTCAPVATTCVACYSHRGAAGGEPITTVTSGCYVRRDLNCLAKAFDPRSWQSCASSAFTKSQRVTYSSATDQYTDVPTSPGDIGNPWTGYLEEQVVVGGDAEFQNFLEITFQTIPSVRVDYQLFESGTFSIPALFIDDEDESVVVDEGYLLAEASTNPIYPAADNWKRVELVKTVRFVDLTNPPGSNPWNIDPGEVLNYWAPVLLSEWLESGTQGAICCGNCPGE